MVGVNLTNLKGEKWSSSGGGKVARSGLSGNKRAETGGHGGDLQAAALEFGIRAEDFCDFSSNINPLGPPQGLEEELKQHLGWDLCRYPTPQARDFRCSLARHLDLPEERLLLGNGASELIHLFFLWLRPRNAYIPAPSFSEYERAARIGGARIIRYPLHPGALLDPDAMVKQLSGPGALVFCNPNNPTGSFIPPDSLEEIIRESGKKEIDVLVDESFFSLTGRPSSESFSRHKSANLWVVTSLTKLWALPGLRLGYLYGSGKKFEELTRNGDPWRVNALAQRAGLYSLGDSNYLRRTLELIREEKEYLWREFKGIQGLMVFWGEANFFLLRGEKSGFSSTGLYRFMASRGILIRNAANFPFLDDRYFRVAVRCRNENIRLLDGLRQYFDGLL
ncbi:MAG: aminotransferase class I/II-fold pyridoxal phosphate-dependent enzyme [Dethiobacter sp.]|jgi:threonine-phosphate decarboxylase|nr:MAG: aminotransferase class I/II-fold pyridoxal phosphate-dependent enzyme [Dethiobacter sp.]